MALLGLNSAAKDLAALMDADSNLNLTLATDLHVHVMPSSPDRVVTVYDAGGTSPTLHLDRDEAQKNPSVSVQVRGAKGQHEAAKQLASDIEDFLDGLTATQGGARYILIRAEGGIQPLGRDDQNRMLLSVNFRTIRTVA